MSPDMPDNVFPGLLCRCGQASAYALSFTDPHSTRQVNRYACANHLTDRVWAALMQAGSRPVTISPLGE